MAKPQGRAGAAAGARLRHPDRRAIRRSLGRTWDEIDEATDGSIPKGRMKAAKEHRVPLSDPTLAILKAQHEAQQGESKPARLSRRPMSRKPL